MRQKVREEPKLFLEEPKLFLKRSQIAINFSLYENTAAEREPLDPRSSGTSAGGVSPKLTLLRIYGFHPVNATELEFTAYPSQTPSLFVWLPSGRGIARFGC